MFGGLIFKLHVGAVEVGTLTGIATDVTAPVIDPSVGKAVIFASQSYLIQNC